MLECDIHQFFSMSVCVFSFCIILFAHLAVENCKNLILVCLTLVLLNFVRLLQKLVPSTCKLSYKLFLKFGEAHRALDDEEVQVLLAVFIFISPITNEIKDIL